MLYYTGDIHGDPAPIEVFCKRMELTEEDTIVILGDVGVNYYGQGKKRDIQAKERLNALGPIIFCIHGNHEIRPANIPSYELREWNGGMVWQEPDYPNLLFGRDGDIFTIEGIRHLVIGGAYSVDKFYRLENHYGWWPDEQPSEEVKRYVERQVATKSFDFILSHTCPFKYEPVEAFLSQIDQKTVDDSTERWLDEVESKANYAAWLCGHWHINKRIDKMHFLFHDFECSEYLMRSSPREEGQE